MADATPGSGAPSSNRNVMILLSYLWLLALIPLVVEKDDREVQWHAKHGLVLTVAELIFWVAFQVLMFVLGSFLGCLVAIFAPIIGLGVRGAAHLRDHQGHQRPATDRSGHQPVRGQVLTSEHVAAFMRRVSCLALLPSICDSAPAEQWSARARPSAPSTCIKPRCRDGMPRVGVQCRFTPTCSHYGEACIRRFGVARGGWLAMKRVLRCGPWTPLGTADPPPV